LLSSALARDKKLSPGTSATNKKLLFARPSVLDAARSTEEGRILPVEELLRNVLLEGRSDERFLVLCREIRRRLILTKMLPRTSPTDVSSNNG
jgi:hypothetical protein